MDENVELTDEQKEIKNFIRIYVKIMLYVPFIMILIVVIDLIVKGFIGGFN